jgi:phage gp45-like
MATEYTEEKFGSVEPEDLQEGQRVVYHPVGHAMQTSVGKIIRIIKHPEEVGTRHTVVKATEEEPRYVHLDLSDTTNHLLGHH